jgi:D-lactate dehydrogenase (quinone)
LAKKAFMTQAFTPATLDAMRGIKQLFDPDGILNPGKTLPDHPKPADQDPPCRVS